jgi:hypothetical protein
MKIPKSTLLTREVAFTLLGLIGLTQGKLAAHPDWLRLPPTS